MQKYSVLAVDDEPFNLDLIEAAFHSYNNIQLTYAKSGQETLEALKHSNFNVILLDISMPGMSGIEVLQKIRADKKLEGLPVLMVTANTEKEKECLEIGASDFISKPYDIDILCSRTINYAKLNYFTREIQNQKNILEEQVQERTKELQKALTLSKETEYEISIRLGRASESRDPETGGHIKRMSAYSYLLAQLCGLDAEEARLVLYAAPLHDIGKIGIPDSILLKPGRFEKEEFEIMKTHSELGASMLSGAEQYPVLAAGKIIAMQQHEKYNGTGYPNGLKGEEIHLYARIVTIADVFDALNSKRCYKKSMSLEKVLEIMKQDAGIHFDPKLIDIFFKNLDKFLEIKERYSDEKTIGFTQILNQTEKKQKILFVDDNELNRIVLKEMLLLIFPGLEIETFATVEETSTISMNQYDVILTGINMPTTTGYEFYDSLKNRLHFSKPIIAVSGEKEKVLDYGFNDFISQPIDIQNVEEVLKKFL